MKLEVSVNKLPRLPSFIFSLLIVLLIASCGKKHGDPVGPYPTVDQLLKDGWAAYLAADYDLAIAKFDSVVNMKADTSEAFLGLGWSQAQNGQFTEGLSNFSLAISLEGIRPALEVLAEDSDDITVASATDTTWYIKPLNTPLLGVPEMTVKVFGDTLIHPDSLFDEVLYDVVGLTDSSITIKWNSDFAVDTFFLAPDSADLVVLNYSYLDVSIGETEIQVDAYAGMATLTSAQNEELQAIINGNGVLQMDNTYSFSHDPTGATAWKIHVLLAQSYYNLALFLNACGEVTILDTSWVCDPNSPTYLYDLQQKIESL